MPIWHTSTFVPVCRHLQKIWHSNVRFLKFNLNISHVHLTYLMFKLSLMQSWRHHDVITMSSRWRDDISLCAKQNIGKTGHDFNGYGRRAVWWYRQNARWRRTQPIRILDTAHPGFVTILETRRGCTERDPSCGANKNDSMVAFTIWHL